VNRTPDVGPGDDQVLVAAFQLGVAEIGCAQVGLLQHGAHRAIQDQDAFADEFPQGQALLE
jgi:hypothetical protein